MKTPAEVFTEWMREVQRDPPRMAPFVVSPRQREAIERLYPGLLK